jgi:hypothetical protein
MIRGLVCLAVLVAACVGPASAAAPPVADGPWEVGFISRAEAMAATLQQYRGGRVVGPGPFEDALLLDMEKAYWNLYGGYCQLYCRELALWNISQTCRLAQLRYEAGLLKKPDFTRAREQFELYRSQRMEAIRTIKVREMLLRHLYGVHFPANARLAPDDSPLLPRSARFHAHRARRQALAKERDSLLEAYRAGKGNNHHAVVEAQIAWTEAVSAEYREIVAWNIRQVERGGAPGALAARARRVIADWVSCSTAEPSGTAEQRSDGAEEIIDSGSVVRMLQRLPLPQRPWGLFLAPGIAADHRPSGYFEVRR